jgi:hypothetical protein
MANTFQCDETLTSVVHGIRVETTTPLLPRCLESRKWTHDLQATFEISSSLSEADNPLDGELVAHQCWQGATEYAFSRSGDLLRFSFPDFCAGVAHLEKGTLAVRAKLASDASLVFPNTILSAVLGPETAVVLHASAVAKDGHTIGICGTSGAGKSSLATALSLAGYTVVSDDALRVQLGNGAAVTCFPGAPELRLRQLRNWQLPKARLRPLPDDRLGYIPERQEHEVTALRALVFPNVSPLTPKPTVERLRGERGLEQLLCASRIAWTGHAGVRSFRLLARLQRVIPLYGLHLPDTFLDSVTHPSELCALLGQLEGT